MLTDFEIYVPKTYHHSNCGCSVAVHWLFLFSSCWETLCSAFRRKRFHFIFIYFCMHL